MLMKVALTIFFIVILNFNLFAIEIDESSSNLNILSKSSIFIDETDSLLKEQVSNETFSKNTKDVLGLGFVPHKALWIRFSLKNSSEKPISKILEYANPTTEDLYFYDGENIIVDGMWHINADRESLHPSFKIYLHPYEEKTFYIKAHSNISTLIANLTLWEPNEFLKYDYGKKTYLFIFFAIISTLLLYNFMLLIFTKDKAYLYYVLYLGSIIFFQLNYLGISQLYLFSNEISIFVAKASMIYISFLILSIILFTREFLYTPQFTRLDRILVAYLYITPVVGLLSYNNFLFNLNIVTLFIPAGILIIYIGFYALAKGVKQARFYVIGWSFVLLSLIFMNLKTVGIFDMSIYFAYINEVAFVLEALLFSIALAHRINILSKEKNEAQRRLRAFEIEEKHRLEALVDERTKDLSFALEEKDILYKELNHRVKNNIQMVLSLIRLQISKTGSKKVKDELTITKDRINSVANLYEVLYFKKSTHKFDTQVYFENIINNMQENITHNITIEYKIDYNVNAHNLIYCGLILNELVTNSFKYAHCSEVTIYIYKEDDYIYMIVKDDGDGFTKDKKPSLGFNIIETLVKKQLHGELDIYSKVGTMTTIKWRENE